MFTTIRRYRCDPASVPEIAHAVDEHFADRLAEQPGFVAYEIVDCGSGEIFSTTVFTDRQTAERSTDMANQFIAERLSGIELERLGVDTGEVLVNRANRDVLEMVHA